MRQGVSKDPLLKTAFENILKAIMKPSRYFGRPAVHAIRRGLGKYIDGKFFFTSCRSGLAD